MDKKLNLILCAQGHLPSGTGDAEFEALYHGRIKPIVSALDKFPRINMTFYYSGVILYWIERRHPEFFMLLEDLLSRKQVEFLGGGFYNPALPLLPLADKIGQIEMLSTYLRKHFGKRPQGCWLPALAWEQNLVGPLTSSGMSYTFLGDMQFSGAGVKPDAAGIFNSCITEDQGKLITVFPSASSIGRELQKGSIGKILGRLIETAVMQNGETPVLVLPVGDEAAPLDEAFFEELSKADSRIEFTSPLRIYKSLRFLKKVYFPCVLANDSHPRQFLADHAEAGGIYSKMIYVHTLINNQLRGDKTRKRTALEELWKSQDSGIFRTGTKTSPGLFNSPVRKAAYSALLEAEKITREKKKFSPSLSFFDYDLDGEGEYIFQDDKLNCYIKSRGAGVFELDYLPAAWNYLDTLAASSKTEGAERRCAFADWLAPANTLPSDVGPDGIKRGFFCGAKEYETSETDRVHRSLAFTLKPREGMQLGTVEIGKTFQLKKNTISVDYVLTNTGTQNLNFIFSSSLDLSFPGEDKEILKILTPGEGEKALLAFKDSVTVKNIKVLEFQDIKNEALITLELSRYFDGQIFHVRSGPGGAGEYQSTCVMPLLPVFLEKGKTWKLGITLKISS